VAGVEAATGIFFSPGSHMRKCQCSPLR
jgi:hypothetical protein